MKNKLKLLTLAVAMGVGSVANASIVTYVLDQTNVSGFIEPGNFGTVTIEDGIEIFGDVNAVKFTVDVNNDVLSARPSSPYRSDDALGVQQFGFNLNGISLPSARELNSIRLPTIFDPSSYSVTLDGRLDGFGTFAVIDRTFNEERVVDPLVFYIVGIDGDTVNSYIAPSSGFASQGNALFAAEIVGFQAFVDSTGSTYYKKRPQLVDEGFFATSVGSQPLPIGQPPAAVPLPAAVWMFGAGLMGLLRLNRRRSLAD